MFWFWFILVWILIGLMISLLIVNDTLGDLNNIATILVVIVVFPILLICLIAMTFGWLIGKVSDEDIKKIWTFKWGDL